MVFGIGTDIVAVARLERLYRRHGEAALEKILAPAERADFARVATAKQGRFLAKRWAAKEALGKALGTGLRPPTLPAAIVVTHDALGKPAFRLDAVLQARLDAVGIVRAQLSISDETLYAIAFVVLEQRP
ncbi:MAG: holo-ACP synthase [Burkholderiaceae bacterium]|jgi:holo-[acyl-carrier protein] synthase|nr:holo-ACP synthase [Burkholderiaceae bacterium]